MTKPEIIILLRAVFADTQRVIATQDNQKCFEPEGEKWSIAQHLQHLIMSAAPVASIYKQPKEFLLGFGQPTMGHRATFLAGNGIFYNIPYQHHVKSIQRIIK